MGKYNYFFQNKFGSCRQLANARDLHRNRDVRIYALPGEFDVVGVTDGVDCWCAPVSADPFNVKIGQLLSRLRDGENIQVVNAVVQRRKLLVPLDIPEDPPPVLRHRPVRTPGSVPLTRRPVHASA